MVDFLSLPGMCPPGFAPLTSQGLPGAQALLQGARAELAAVVCSVSQSLPFPNKDQVWCILLFKLNHSISSLLPALPQCPHWFTRTTCEAAPLQTCPPTELGHRLGSWSHGSLQAGAGSLASIRNTCQEADGTTQSC